MSFDMSDEVWNGAVLAKGLSDKQVDELRSWAFRVYFGERNQNKPWYDSKITESTVLRVFTLLNSPISPISLIELWLALPSLQRDLSSMEDKDLNLVATYLGRDRKVCIPKYNNGDASLRDMASTLHVTSTMITKIFSSSSEKLRILTNGLPFDEINEDVTIELLDRIKLIQEKAANEYAFHLWRAEDPIAFLRNLVEKTILTENEWADVSIHEIEALRLLLEMKFENAIEVLLLDLEDEDNIFKSFQNFASRRLFPRRSGRPLGSKNAKSELVEDELPEVQD